ncbi:[protein-PII] uridylyltransferase [Natronospira bacteriovora]|uniref:Bifunctional uridylyltransferase/uridylyl-removing enzyme n=1 Tax=Natronospira bacteriovora TaxID=3069753 RepID=A0ABU0W2V4_9GAMM|nr:[protein-PII] uridylyltransferase [Natronospira sp. AB-CW4]MDQ2068347.1 [protein-PII] uridylyltransferase [Natronospira sp. AB-CW4]
MTSEPSAAPASRRRVTPPRFDRAWLEELLGEREPLPQHLRAAHKHASTRLREMAAAGLSASHLVAARSRMMDTLLRALWRRHLGGTRGLVLIAVGGYGRGELHPWSDIDLMVLINGALPAQRRTALQQFLTELWDIGPDVGHSVRTLEECRETARQDITIATNLIEARRLVGAKKPFEALRQLTFSDELWTSRSFFERKLEEQRDRHHKFHDTAYKLEPNVKESPGGLRDIQMIGWVAKRHFGARTLSDLASYGFLSRDEHRKLVEGQSFLWRVRWLLHESAGRKEDRLLFDYQLKLAKRLGYEDQEHSLAVEQFMQRYYRTVMELNRLNEMLLQLFKEAILLEGEPRLEPINEHFQLKNGYLDVVDRDVFRRDPSALLELFHVLQQQPEAEGVSAGTIRLIRQHRRLINERFRRDPKNKALFMAILREPQGVTHEFRRMNSYGVLGRYIPEFGHIVGRMQYDLFHTYTVDEHTLFVLSNLRRFALSRFDHEYPECSRIMQALPKPELAYLAGLFHDIAKGRGGDHSELGADDALRFCRRHGLSNYDSRLVAWLVRQHLLLSLTAQKKDISDPRVIHDFAEKVGDQLHLDYLYVLTVADVRATNPELWNSWKGSLFQELYNNTSRALRRGLINPVARDEMIAETQRESLERLAKRRVAAEHVRDIWKALPGDYFLRHSPSEIEWHTEALMAHANPNTPLVQVRRANERGGTAVFVCSPRDDLAFARSTAALEQLGLTVLDARIVSTRDERTLYTWVVLEADGEEIDDPRRSDEIFRIMREEAGRLGGEPRAIRRRMPRQHRSFSTPTRIHFDDDERNGRTILEISTGDRPGLLTRIAGALRETRIRLQTAKVATVGEKAEDIFFITETDDSPLNSEERRQALADALLRRLDDDN